VLVVVGFDRVSIWDLDEIEESCSDLRPAVAETPKWISERFPGPTLLIPGLRHDRLVIPFFKLSQGTQEAFPFFLSNCLLLGLFVFPFVKRFLPLVGVSLAFMLLGIHLRILFIT